jgi:hypothetical protein
MNEMPIFWHQSEVNIMWQESREWMKFGGNAFFCFIVFGFLNGIVQKKSGNNSYQFHGQLRQLATE